VKKSTNPQMILDRYRIKSPYLLYVGSLYPHKNIDRLIEAVKISRQEGENVNLVIASARNAFWERIKNKLTQEGATDFVNLVGFVPDNDLASLYRQAHAFVFPSLMEGFGLPGLEAMSLNCPIIASQSSCLPEIYGSAALFFDPQDPRSIARQIIKLTVDKKLRQNLVKKGQERVKKYSWQKCAQETLAGYQQVLSSLEADK
jgi:glycosyltransferase involved in cell wall biosynthesis